MVWKWFLEGGIIFKGKSVNWIYILKFFRYIFSFYWSTNILIKIGYTVACHLKTSILGDMIAYLVNLREFNKNTSERIVRLIGVCGKNM